MSTLVATDWPPVAAAQGHPATRLPPVNTAVVTDDHRGRPGGHREHVVGTAVAIGRRVVATAVRRRPGRAALASGSALDADGPQQRIRPARPVSPRLV